MGEARRHKMEFQSGKYLCIFCGGLNQAFTEDHVPPRVLFLKKEWPEGFVFPACEKCNSKSSDNDLIVGVMAKMTNDREDVRGLLMNLRKQKPTFIDEMIRMSASEARKSVKKFKLLKPQGMTYREVGVVNVNEAMREAVINLARKLSKAIFYKKTGNIFPLDGGILLNWFTNTQLFEHGGILVLQGLSHFNYQTEEITRNTKSLRDQFDYRYSLSEEGTIHLIQVTFGNSFGFVTLMSEDRRILESINEKAQHEAGKDSVFQFIS
ncbi:hypothetical protein MCERHM31_00980 [Methylophilaceae bacterium]